MGNPKIKVLKHENCNSKLSVEHAKNERKTNKISIKYRI